jgi:hypothetical protein
MTSNELIIVLALATFALVILFAVINYTRTRQKQHELGEDHRKGKGFEPTSREADQRYR